MKISLFLLVIILLTLSCNQDSTIPIASPPPTKAVVYMVKTSEGFDLYANKGELILQYTKRNCDSLSLSTLDDIYFTAIEFYDREPSE